MVMKKKLSKNQSIFLSYSLKAPSLPRCDGPHLFLFSQDIPPKKK
jgi:hypothetical protein